MPKIIDAILKGYIEAQQSYEEMSGGFWLWNATEYFITSNVAQNIYAIEGEKFVTLEHGSTDAIESAGAKGRGRLPKDIREKGRVDILLWRADSTPRAIIEIKNQIYSKDQYEKDITRIKSFLSRNHTNSTLQFGIFAFYESAFNGIRKTATEKIEARVNKIFDNSKLILGSNFDIKLYVTDMHDESENAWQAACIFVKLKKSVIEK